MTGLRISAVDRHGRSVEVDDRTGIVVARHDHHRVVVAGLGGDQTVIKRTDDGDLGLESQHEREATGLPDEEIRIKPAVIEGARTVEYRRRVEAVITQCCGDPRPEPINVGRDFGPVVHGQGGDAHGRVHVAVTAGGLRKTSPRGGWERCGSRVTSLSSSRAAIAAAVWARAMWMPRQAWGPSAKAVC